MTRRVTIIGLALAFALYGWQADEGKKKQKKRKRDQEPITQVLELPKDPPAALVADIDHLSFTTIPLSAKGLLSQQLRDAVKALLRQNKPVVRLRVFVAGTGDTRRVQSIVSEVFSDRKAPLPVLTVVQVGALPGDGAQVMIEAVTLEKKPVNPNGLAFISAQHEHVAEPLQPVQPLLEKAAARLKAAAAGDIVQLSCTVSTIDDAAKTRALLATAFPNASLTLVQPLRGALQSGAACSAIARLAAAPPAAAEHTNPEGLDHPPGASAIVRIGPKRVAFSGAQLAFGTAQADARLAYQRLEKSLDQVTASLRRTAVAEIYTLSREAGDEARRAANEFFDQAKPPSIIAAPFEGLPSMDASFAIDVIALLSESTQETR